MSAVLLRRVLLPLLVIAGLVVAWDVAIRLFAVPAYVVPTPASVGQAGRSPEAVRRGMR